MLRLRARDQVAHVQVQLAVLAHGRQRPHLHGLPEARLERLGRRGALRRQRAADARVDARRVRQQRGHRVQRRRLVPEPAALLPPPPPLLARVFGRRRGRGVRPPRLGHQVLLARLGRGHGVAVAAAARRRRARRPGRRRRRELLLQRPLVGQPIDPAHQDRGHVPSVQRTLRQHAALRAEREPLEFRDRRRVEPVALREARDGRLQLAVVALLVVAAPRVERLRAAPALGPRPGPPPPAAAPPFAVRPAPPPRGRPRPRRRARPAAPRLVLLRALLLGLARRRRLVLLGVSRGRRRRGRVGGLGRGRLRRGRARRRPLPSLLRRARRVLLLLLFVGRRRRRPAPPRRRLLLLLGHLLWDLLGHLLLLLGRGVVAVGGVRLGRRHRVVLRLGARGGGVVVGAFLSSAALAASRAAPRGLAERGDVLLRVVVVVVLGLLRGGLVLLVGRRGAALLALRRAAAAAR
mmetsp:Transcript_23661/g.73098  ORF Transcript_23661/g.73098 Transcript_23661/m.73098 type:complete len:464 (+) Transcript_23661:881-2272(+)